MISSVLLAISAAFAVADSVRPGIEVLLTDSLPMLQGKRVGLITNHTGRDRQGRRTIDLLVHAPGVNLVALFGPEHGLAGVAAAGAKIGSSTDSATGLPIYSLYGDTRVPTPQMLENVDVLVYDIQDVGARVYTFVWTMSLAAEAAGKLGKSFVVLDRPNPIRADVVQGNVLESKYRSFVGQYEVALRYGLTPGELLRFLVETGRVHANVTVVPMQRYRRAMWYSETGIPWINPSPNIRDEETALLYPGTVFFEATNLSEGRGTDAPLKQAGADWLTDAPAIARELNGLRIRGIRFEATQAAVDSGQKFGGKTIPAIRLHVIDRDAADPIAAAVWMMRIIHRRHPSEWKWRKDGIESLAGTAALRRVVERGGVRELLARWRRESTQFRKTTQKYWLYR
ncbi:MAG TPA: DUF1343 domain-containing protein [Gemmatimonadaceae bacterium]|jgi:uncharacterized protein YbbC (DUF1343 family)